jgi:hypothetical protein
MHTTPTSAARKPGKQLALLSLVAALVAPVAMSLTVVLYHLEFAVWCPQGGIAGCPPLPPAGQLVEGMVQTLEQVILLTLPPSVVAIISGHLAVDRMRHHAAPRRWRRVARWGLILGYGAPVFFLAYSVWLLLTGQFGGE